MNLMDLTSLRELASNAIWLFYPVLCGLLLLMKKGRKILSEGWKIADLVLSKKIPA